MGRLLALPIACFFVLAPVTMSYGQGFPEFLQVAGESSGVQPRAPFFMELGLRKYINSFTSYQFPDGPGGIYGNDPLSRLEWPWDQWFGVVRAGSNFGAFALKGEYAGTLLRFNSRRAQDSDWEYPGAGGQKSTFSDAKDRPRSMVVDLSLEASLPGAPSVKGVIGYRKQRLNFSFADAFDRTLGGYPPFFPPPSSGYDPNEGIAFSQSYAHYYGGGIFSTAVDLGSVANATLPTILMEIQGDYAIVKANNVDQHFIRPAAEQPRFTKETTKGNAWHVKLKVGLFLTGRITASIEGDFMRIRTTGPHRFTNGTGVDVTWSGAKVWSDQQYVAFNGSFEF